MNSKGTFTLMRIFLIVLILLTIRNYQLGIIPFTLSLIGTIGMLTLYLFFLFKVRKSDSGPN